MGGRWAKPAEKTSASYGTPVVVGDRGIACTGTVSIIDLTALRETAQIPVGLHPSDLLLSKDTRALYVANANSDTVSVIDTATRQLVSSITVRPDPRLLFGSALAEQFVLLDDYYCNGVLSTDGHHWATEGITTDYIEKPLERGFVHIRATATIRLLTRPVDSSGVAPSLKA